MAASKRRRLNEDDEQSSDSDNSSNDSSNSEDVITEENVEVDFEAYPPTDSDFHGIRRLLEQLFRKAHIDVSKLTDLLIEQNSITSVIKQALLADDMEMEDEDEDVCFGVFSIVNMTEKKDLECIKQLQSFLMNQCQQSCSEKEVKTFESFFADKDTPLGLIFSERFVNTPHEISVLLYDRLSKDMEAINKDKPSYKFGNYMLISKILSAQDMPSSDESTMEYENAEEELLAESAGFTFDFSVTSESSSGLGARWHDDDEEFQRKRRVLVFSADKWPSMIATLKEKIPIPQ